MPFTELTAIWRLRRIWSLNKRYGLRLSMVRDGERRQSINFPLSTDRQTMGWTSSPRAAAICKSDFNVWAHKDVSLWLRSARERFPLNCKWINLFNNLFWHLWHLHKSRRRYDVMLSNASTYVYIETEYTLCSLFAARCVGRMQMAKPCDTKSENPALAIPFKAIPI